ncbi:response regulator [Nostoc sp. UHCC 0870]|uniref:response regulator n=1 Tax=Nostoc sp. UHCC 0870 TaxID=2914041 RepID=UPI001EE0D974|nr:response regulator [Nostoc sp. UHCC 0870]UKO96056.1 response regulator [Nostoc sp. UHCC 0870]
MLPEQQQRILGYFIEEARDHLNTIEQGLLNLQSTLNDPEMINEVFRAAHSIKGGAAMLGLNSIQHTSHRLEDCFKVLKENPIQVDQKLESLFLGVSDTLKALLEQLSGPFGLSEETANTLMSETEPVFQWLNQHLELLVQQSGTGIVETSTFVQPTAIESVATLTEIFFRQDLPTTTDNTAIPQEAPTPVTTTTNDYWGEFQAQVLQILREMLQLFKQKATPESRQNLQQCCHQLVKLGQNWNLPNWCTLSKAAATAIGNSENSYLTLAKIVITEIKKAQELVLQGRELEITISQQLESLWGFPETALLEVAQGLLGDVPSTVTQSLTTPAPSVSQQKIHEVVVSAKTEELPKDSITSLTEVSEQLDLQVDTQVTSESTAAENDINTNLFWESQERPFVHAAKIDNHGPEVGLAELNSLADLFEGETQELDDTWQHEEIIEKNGDSSELEVEINETIIQEIDNDLADFLSLDGDAHQFGTSTDKIENLGLLFGDILTEQEKSPQNFNNTGEIIPENIHTTEIQEDPEILEEFLNITNSDINQLENETITSIEESTNSSNSFDDLFLEQDLNTNTLEEVKLHHQPVNNLNTPLESVSLDNIFEDLEENTEISTDELETSNILDEQPIRVWEFAANAEDLGSLWNQEISIEPEQLLASVVENEIGQELEDSLLAVAESGEIFRDSEESMTSGLENFDVEDLNTTFLQPEEDLDLILESNTDENLFAELASTDSIITPDLGDRRIYATESPEFSQAPEALDFIPEFTNQLPETSSVNSQLSFAELAVGLFNESDDNDPIESLEGIDNIDDNFFTATSNLNLQQNAEVSNDISMGLESDIELSDIDENSEFDLDANLRAITNELPTNNLEEWAIPISQLTDIVIEDITINDSQLSSDELLDTAGEENSELDFGEYILATTHSELSQTTIQDFTENISFDLGNTVGEETSNLDFAELSQTTIPDFTENISFDLGNTVGEETSNLDFAELSQTTIPDFTENISFDLGNTVGEETSNLDFAELSQTTIPDLTETIGLDLGNTVGEETSNLDFAELSQTTIQDFTENISFDLDNTVGEETSDLDFAELSQTTIQDLTETIGLDLGNTVGEETSNLDFAELSQTTIQDFTENISFDLDNTVGEETSDLDFAELSQTTIQDLTETIGLDLDNTVGEETSNLDFAELSQTTIQDLTETIGLDLGHTVDEETSDLDFAELDIEPSSELKDENPDASSELILNAITPDIEETNTVALPLETDTSILDEFADLDALLEVELSPNNDVSSIQEDDFADLEALLGEDNTSTTPNEQQNAAIPPATPKFIPPTTSNQVSSPVVKDEFSDLEKLLAEADQTISQSTPVKQTTGKLQRSSTRRQAKFEETMKVPVKQLDDMSNLVGELVVNRNTLEQDHERLRQSLDNLLVQVQQLSDVGARMQELYERSLLEASLLASRKTREIPLIIHDPNADRGLSALEMDRFTPFHTLSQEMIELIVRVRESASDIDFVTEETERVARQFRQVTTQLQEGLTRARMVPFSQTIDRLRRGVRDNAIKCGKQVELMIEGGDTLIDKMILDHLTDPLTHMLNNAIAHGIETPDIRQASGKPPVGIITIRAFHQGNQTVISVGDDGAGIDTNKIKTLAVKRGMITPEQAKNISRLEIYDLLFHAGFSTKDEADEISGRGVGMDVVRSEISEIRGIVNTDSTLTKGTTFTIRLPLTLSICKALCCVSDKAKIAFPMDGVEDTLDIPSKNIQKNADGQSFIYWRDTILPFRPLKELLTFNRQLSRGSVYGGNRDDDMISVVVVRSGNTLLALQIDLVLSEQEIVIKQFESPAPKPIGVAGATVLGDGRIMPIADVLELIDIFQGRMSKQSGNTLWPQAGSPSLPEPLPEKIDPTVLIVDDSITVRELLSLTFNKAGYRVEQARDGQEAWDKLRSGLPCDIVFCDIEMPRCDGLELLSRIQKDSNLNHLPIAMLTSRGADKHRQMAIQLGASGYFTKPYLEEALLEAAVRMLKGEKLVNSVG